MAAYYNENDPRAAAWLRELIRRGLIAPGDVDERDIADVVPTELAGFTQCHFFAGIGAWSFALRAAGWPDDRAVWTGSCPCQPFSAAGQGAGFADERHLWPVFFHLVSHGKRRNVPVLGEQVASRDGLMWLDLVSLDLEGAGYAVGCVDTCAASVGAPHIRQRLYWVADAPGRGSQVGWSERANGNATQGRQPDGSGDAGGVADTAGGRRREEHQDAARFPGGNRTQGDPAGSRAGRGDCWPGPVNGHWRAADWIFCRDGRWRPVEPGASPLAHGSAARVGRLRGYGNSLCAPQAAAFVRAYMEMTDV